MELSREITVFPDNSSLSSFAADKIAEFALASVEARGLFHFVLSGGGTPTALYRRLAKPPFVDSFPWLRSHFYWGDERNVPPDEEGSNFGQAHDILLSKVPVPEANIHRIKGELSSAKAAKDYVDQLLGQADPGLNWPRFDVVLLGMGADGHTASLFPGQKIAEDISQPIVPVMAHYGGRPANRLTMTPPVFNAARNIIFLVTGADKAAAVAASIDGNFDPLRKPTQRIRPATGQVIWLLNEGAAGNLTNL